jgi:hypothetical protein
MKRNKLFIALILCFLPLMAFSDNTLVQESIAQNSNDQPTYKVYLAIIRSTFSSTIRVDMGNSNGKDDFYDENGKKVDFNSTIDAVDYFSARGWTLETGMGVLSSDRFGQYYLMSKTLSKEEYETFKKKIGLH